MSEWKDGLPPVGEWCFGESEAGVEFECFIVATHTSGDSRVVVFRYEDGELEAATDGNAYAFRPLKSEAELKREKAVEEMVFDARDYEECLGRLTHIKSGPGIHKVTAEILYLHGYRKVNELTDEQIQKVCNRFEGKPWTFKAIINATQQELGIEVKS